MYEKHTKHFLVANVTFHCVFLFIMLDTGRKNESTDTYTHTHNNEQSTKNKSTPSSAWIQKMLFRRIFYIQNFCCCLCLSYKIFMCVCVCVCLYDFAFNAKPLSKYFLLSFLFLYTKSTLDSVGSMNIGQSKCTLNSAYVCCGWKSSFKTWSENEKEKKWH